MRGHGTAVVMLVALLVNPAPLAAQCGGALAAVGRWDLTVAPADGDRYPSWLEVSRSGACGLVGRFVGRVGSARPIGRVEYVAGAVRFVIPPQWESGSGDLRLEGTLYGDTLRGTMVLPSGQEHPFAGERAPALQRAEAVTWGEPLELFNGRDLAGWKPFPPDAESHWRAVDGELINAASGANLMTTRTFDDFTLHLEFRYPAQGNSGVYLRGRHEVQIEDSPAREWPEALDLGGIYGFLAPNQAAGRSPDEWQTFDITLVGRRVTVVLNGRTIISDQIIPGITGGALDSREGRPGPLLLQGDHTAVAFRNIRLTPAAGARDP